MVKRLGILVIRGSGKTGFKLQEKFLEREKDDAEEVLEFSRWFLRYVYVLLKQLEDRKARLSSPATEPSG